MRERYLLATAVVVIVVVALGLWFYLIGPHREPSGTGTRLGQQDAAMIAKGRYLATLADCQACHTADDDKPYAGGKAVETPFGTVVAANITPDRATGIGTWSDEEFDNAVRRGIMPNGAHLYPAMPYPFYAKMSKDDVKAIRAYLNTVTPVDNDVVSNKLPFPFSIRRAMWAWNLLYFSPGTYQPDKSKPEKWNRGAYLVEGPGHCGACHTPKTLFGGDETDNALHGAFLQGWFAPDITDNVDRGLGRWSANNIVRYLKTGHNRLSAATGTMSETVRDSTSKTSHQDLEAIALYLKSVDHTARRRTALGANDPRMKAGQAIFVDTCSACHAMDGSGSPSLFPSLAQSSNVRQRNAASLIRIVLEGARSVATKGEPTAPAMPSYSWQLNDEQIADVLTYIRNSWGAAAPAVSQGDVKDVRKSLTDSD